MISINNSIVTKDNIKINYKNLYDYLYSRGFNYLPNLINYNDNKIELEYVEDIKTDKRLKALDMIKIVALLHTKTAYFTDISENKYKKIYNDLNNNIKYMNNYYEDIFNKYLLEKNPIPSHYLFITNYSIIYWFIKYTKDELNIWFNSIKTSTKERICLIHNNLKLEHFIKNINEYLISWDNYTYDSPVLDLYTFIKNESSTLSIKEIIDSYQEIFKLTENELRLLYIMLSVNKLEFSNNEYNNCNSTRKLINYLEKVYELVNKAKEDETIE